MNDSLRQPKPSPRTLLCWALLVLSPFAALAAMSLILGVNAFTGLPVWSDELDYWRAAWSWIEAGPNTGYYGLLELHAPVGALSSHGPTSLLFYAPMARAFGWPIYGMVIANAAWVSLGALALVLLLRPSAGTTLALTATLTLYAPNLLFSLTSMTETLNYGLLLFYLAFLLRYWKTRGKAALALCGVALLALIVYRASYLLLLIPLVLAAYECRITWKAIGTLIGLGAAALGVYWAVGQLTSPYPAEFMYNMLNAGDWRISAHMFLSHAKANLIDYFVRPTENAMEIAQRWLYCVTTGLCGVGSVIGWDKEKKRPRVRLDWLCLTCFAVLGLAFALVICAYEANDWADYRTLAPYLWCAAAALALRNRKALTGAFLAGCVAVLAVLALTPAMEEFTGGGRYEAARYSADMQALCEAIPYDADAADPYENTVRTDLYDLQMYTQLHPGLGLETGWFDTDTTGKSKWILTDYLKCVVEDYEPVLSNSAGCVYKKIGE